MIGVEMADLWTLVGAICILVERLVGEEVETQPKLKRNTMWRCPRDNVDYSVLISRMSRTCLLHMHVFLLPTRCSVT
jgi:hypothetical protein